MNKLLSFLLAGTMFLNGCFTQFSPIPRNIEKRISNEMEKPNQTPDKYAVLINGKNEKKFVNETSSIYNILLQRGFRSKNIYVLDEFGTENHLYHSDGVASKKSIKTLLSHLERKVDSQDIFVMHISDHGEKIKIPSDACTNKCEEVTAVILAEDIITEIDLERSLANINPKLGLITTDICYGGGIADRLGKGRYLAVSQTTRNDLGFAKLGDTFGEFFYQAFEKRKEADINEDGNVSVYEAFLYASRNNSFSRKNEVFPLIYSDVDSENAFIE